MHRARSDRNTFEECSELDPTNIPRRNRARNVDPASAITRTQKLRPQSVNHARGLRRQSPRNHVVNNSRAAIFGRGSGDIREGPK